MKVILMSFIGIVVAELLLVFGFVLAMVAT